MPTGKITPLYAETRVLLGLVGAGEEQISPSNFLPKGSQYKEALVQLTESDCLSETLKGKRYKKYSLTSQGKQKLAENLANPELTFFSVLGPKTTNALLKVFRKQAVGTSASTHSESVNVNINGNGHPISSYEDFSEITLKTYEQLNDAYQFEDLVPIYRIRRTIGKQVSREQFNDWLLEMQANDQLQLIGGEMPELTPDKAEDSIKTSLGGIRYYAKRL